MSNTASDDSRRTQFLTATGQTATQARVLSTIDLERSALTTSLALSAANAAKKSINDLRTLSGGRARDDA